MKRIHDEGDIDFSMPDDRYTGDYALMVRSVNDLAHSHIGMLRTVVETVGSYSKGDFRFILDKQPGKKIFINNALDALRKNMVSINEEIGHIVESTARGDLSQRGNDSRFDYAFYADMIKGINNTLNSVVVPINETMKVMGEVASGNLSANMDGDYKGDFYKLKDSVNSTIKRLADIVMKLNSVSSGIEKNSNDIASTAHRLSSGATEQAASVEESSASIEEITATIIQNNENAKVTNNISKSVAMES